MKGLEIKEINSIIDRPTIVKDGALMENTFIVPKSVNRMYLKLETHNKDPVITSTPWFL